MDGNEQWQMKDIGKCFLAATVSGCRQWQHLMSSGHRKPNKCVCVCDDRGSVGIRKEEESLFCVSVLLLQDE